MKLFAFLLFYSLLQFPLSAQSLLGKSRKEILALNENCTALNKYPGVVVFNCAGTKSIYYFTGKDSSCDMYARDLFAPEARDTLQFLISKGFKKTETKYVEPFLATKKGDHQKFPSQVYTDGLIQYCFMPVSMNGKTAESNAVIVMFADKKKKP